MRTLRFIIFVLASLISGTAGYWFLPAHFIRRSGTLDLALLIDWSSSNRETLPDALCGADKVLKDVLPGDRLAVFAVGPEVNELALGPVASTASLSILRNQVASLKPAIRGGSALPDALGRVRAAFDDFLRAYDGKHRRMLIIFSNCLYNDEDATRFADLELPGQASVLVVGFRGSSRDTITKALLGSDGSNDVHIVPPSDTEQAIAGIRKDILAQCHPLRPLPIGVGLTLSAAAGGLAAAAASALLRRPHGVLTVRLLQNGDSETAQEFALREGGVITIGGGDGLHDFPVSANGSCAITRARAGLTLAPANGALALQRDGSPLAVAAPCLVRDGDTFILEGTPITVRQL